VTISWLETEVGIVTASHYIMVEIEVGIVTASRYIMVRDRLWNCCN